MQEELKKKPRNIAISILRGISIRMPMLLYGANIEDEDKEITIDNFTSLVDDISWEEFMPRGVTKELFDEFKRYYDPDIFAASGKRIREQARYADSLDIEARIDQIATIFGTFRNPDKEVVGCSTTMTIRSGRQCRARCDTPMSPTACFVPMQKYWR